MDAPENGNMIPQENVLPETQSPQEQALEAKIQALEAQPPQTQTPIEIQPAVEGAADSGITVDANLDQE